MYDSSGKQFGIASSQWLLLDMKSLRPKIIETDELITVRDAERNVFEDPIEKLPAIEEGEVLRKQVDYTDLDINQHVNSNRYVDFILGTFDQEFHHKYNVSDFQLNFVREIKGVNEILLRRKQIQNDTMYMIEGFSDSNKKAYFQSFVRFI